MFVCVSALSQSCSARAAGEGTHVNDSRLLADSTRTHNQHVVRSWLHRVRVAMSTVVTHLDASIMYKVDGLDEVPPQLDVRHV